MIRPAAAIGHIEVRYFLTGAFGGYGSFVRNPDGDGAYRIPLEQEGRQTASKRFCTHRVANSRLFPWI